MIIKSITKRERKLMKVAFEAARKNIYTFSDKVMLINRKHGNFNDFLFKNKYKAQ